MLTNDHHLLTFSRIYQSIKNVLENKNELTPVPPNISQFQQRCIIACRYKNIIASVTFTHMFEPLTALVALVGAGAHGWDARAMLYH